MDAGTAKRQDHPSSPLLLPIHGRLADPPGVETKEELYNL